MRKWANSVYKLLQYVDNLSDDDEDDDAIKYKFPYELFSAPEVKHSLETRIGKVLSKVSLPGPFPHPSKKAEYISALQYLDNHPEKCPEPTEGTDSFLFDSIMSGIVSKAFLKPQQGDDKAERKLGHQCESILLQRYKEDSNDGKVPGVDIVDIRHVGLAAKKDQQYVRGSADAIALERTSESDRENAPDEDSFGLIKCHLVECKCRSGTAGPNGSLAKAKQIRTKIARAKGGNAVIDAINGKTVYMRISSEDPRLSEFIPDSGERIQILHHAYTYGQNTTAFIVGNAQSKIMYGLIVTFEAQLLEMYGSVLKFLYENGLNVFYEKSIDELPLKLIESILQNDKKLKGKYDMDDFKTSLLIWLELMPGNGRGHKFPIPPSNLQLPYEHSSWNSFMHASDSATGLMQHNKAVLPIRSPQCVAVARFFMLYAVVLHRTRQAINQEQPGKKKVNTETDTIKTVRDRWNKAISSSNTVRYASEKLLARSQTKSASDSLAIANTPSNQTKKSAPRLNNGNKKTRYAIDHTITGPKTGKSPIGKGKSKASELDPEVAERCANCRGHPIKIFFQKDNGQKERARFTCDLCGQPGVPYWCSLCKRTLCFDIDRTERIQARLKSKEGDNLRKKFPSLAEYGRGDAPAFYYDVGYQVNKKAIFVGKSCYHIAHPITINEEISASRPSSKRSRLEPIDENSTAN